MLIGPRNCRLRGRLGRRPRRLRCRPARGRRRDHDLAGAIGRPWPIRRHHALLAIEGAALPLIAALPAAFVNREKAGSFRGRFEMRLRGGGRTVLAFDRGSLTLDAPGARDVDAHVWADPAALMLMFIGRQGVGNLLRSGKIAAWGRRPWKLAGMLTALSPP